MGVACIGVNPVGEASVADQEFITGNTQLGIYAIHGRTYRKIVNGNPIAFKEEGGVIVNCKKGFSADRGMADGKGETGGIKCYRDERHQRSSDAQRPLLFKMEFQKRKIDMSVKGYAISKRCTSPILERR